MPGSTRSAPSVPSAADEVDAEAAADASGAPASSKTFVRGLPDAASRCWPNAALRSAPQLGQLSAFLRTVLPHRWQTTENMDAGNVRRVVMLEPLEGHVREVAKIAWPPMRAGSSRLYAGTQSRNSNPSYSLPARHARRRETTFRLWFNHYRTSIAFRTYFRAAKLKRLHHCAARRMDDGVRTGVPHIGPDVDVKASDRCAYDFESARAARLASLAHDNF
jgi:hypothetical protein